MTYKVYGIPNCNTVKKALTWLDEHSIAYEFHNFKKLGVSNEKLAEWMEQYPWEKIMNRAGMTYRKLSDEEKAAIVSSETAIPVLLEKTSMIKRPIVESDKIVALGFDEKAYQEAFL
ncbi:transcriptional regulator, Spx/MgsR family [Spirosomataceae bacterium TFI 002]|nr:transcriptional regulator, Spx/MgsR family [Spirosomataceae bacterium TFI 002]